MDIWRLATWSRIALFWNLVNLHLMYDFSRAVKFAIVCSSYLPSLLWCCWMGIRKSIRPVNIEWWSVVKGANDLHMIQLMLLPPHYLLLIKIQDGLTFLVPAYSSCPGKRPLNRCLSYSSYRSSTLICKIVVICISVFCLSSLLC